MTTQYDFEPTPEALKRVDQIQAFNFALMCFGEMSKQLPNMADSLAAAAVRLTEVQNELHELKTQAILEARAVVNEVERALGVSE